MTTTVPTTAPARITLYYRAGTSDKVYQAEIVPVGNGLFTVNFAYGRRGATLQGGTKTQAPVPYAKARAVFDSLIREKTGKGYTPGEDGTPYQRTAGEQRNTGITPQLLNAITTDRLAECLADPQFVAQEKHDGRRMLVRRQETQVTGINRLGLEVALPLPLADAIAALPEDCILDGEAVGDVLHVFDILQVGSTDLRPRPYSQRLAELACLLTGHEHGSLRLVFTAISATGKANLLRDLRENGREGIVLKRLDAPYTTGRPASGGAQLKFKFYETASCLVTGLNEKRSVALGLKQNGQLVACGNVTIPPDKDIPGVGTLVDVKYLYAFVDSHVLFQPVFLGAREDIHAEDCTLDQLKYKAA